MNLKASFLLATPWLFAALASQANTVFSYDFDARLPEYKYGYTYAEFGSPSHNNGAYVATGGNGGTGGLVGSYNTTGVSGGWAGFGLGLGDWSTYPNYAALVNAKSLADITLSFDLAAGGLTGTSAGVIVELKFEAPDNTLTPNDADTSADALLTLKSNRTLTSNFQTFTSTLDTWTVTGGSFAQFVALFGQFKSANLNIAYESNGALPAFGTDAGNTMTIDNYTMTVVPEPSTLTLLGLGGVALLLRRRR